MDWMMYGGLMFAFGAVIVLLFACVAVVVLLGMASMLRDFWRYWRES